MYKTATKAASTELPLPGAGFNRHRNQDYGSGGKYSFSAKPGTYFVELTLPSNFTNSSAPPPAVTLASGEANNDFDFVSTTSPPLAIPFGMFSMLMVLDSNESGIDGVTVALVQGSTVIETRLRQVGASIRSALNREPTPLS